LQLLKHDLFYVERTIHLNWYNAEFWKLKSMIEKAALNGLQYFWAGVLTKSFLIGCVEVMKTDCTSQCS